MWLIGVVMSFCPHNSVNNLGLMTLCFASFRPTAIAEAGILLSPDTRLRLRRRQAEHCGFSFVVPCVYFKTLDVDGDDQDGDVLLGATALLDAAAGTLGDTDARPERRLVKPFLGAQQAVVLDERDLLCFGGHDLVLLGVLNEQQSQICNALGRLVETLGELVDADLL